MLQREQDVGRVKPSGVFLKPTNLRKVEEQFTSWAVFQDEEQLAITLEGIIHFYDERMADIFLKTLSQKRGSALTKILLSVIVC